MRSFMQTISLTLATLLFLAAASAVAFGQVPSHTPGSICATPDFWCWAQPYGVYGEPCTCPTAYGDVSGYYI